MKGYVYILECANGHYYIGSTNNLRLRLQEHETERGSQYCKIYHPSHSTCRCSTSRHVCLTRIRLGEDAPEQYNRILPDTQGLNALIQEDE